MRPGLVVLKVPGQLLTRRPGRVTAPPGGRLRGQREAVPVRGEEVSEPVGIPA